MLDTVGDATVNNTQAVSSLIWKILSMGGHLRGQKLQVGGEQEEGYLFSLCTFSPTATSDIAAPISTPPHLGMCALGLRMTVNREHSGRVHWVKTLVKTRETDAWSNREAKAYTKTKQVSKQ